MRHLRHAAHMDLQRLSRALMRPDEPRMPASNAPPSPLAAHEPLARPTGLKAFRGLLGAKPPRGPSKAARHRGAVALQMQRGLCVKRPAPPSSEPRPRRGPWCPSGPRWSRRHVLPDKGTRAREVKQGSRRGSSGSGIRVGVREAGYGVAQASAQKASGRRRAEITFLR